MRMKTKLMVDESPCVATLWAPTMSQALPPRPRQVVQKRSVVIVASEYNATYVQALVDAAAAEIEALAPSVNLSLRQVPGAFEIPLIVKEMALKENVSAIIALGVVIEGETYHADIICRSVTQALQSISLEYRVPVIHEVLYVKNESQARERCLSKKINRGTEAARAAVAMMQLMTDLRARG